jgi:ribosomal protein S18 acetylase RimI-like enzyme
MGGLYAPEDSTDAFVWGMWVEPESRGHGVGARLLGELLDRARARTDDRTVLLHVTEGNDGARHLYESHGFVATGEWEPLREGSGLQIELLRLKA